MKSLVIIILGITFSYHPVLIAQQDAEGVYVSAEDFMAGKTSHVNFPGSEKYHLRMNEYFNTSFIKIIKGDSTINLMKDSIFGFRDRKGISYRLDHRTAYEILNPHEKILIYKRTSLENFYKSSRIATNYYFSINAYSPIYPLTVWDLKKVYSREIPFIQLLQYFFSSDEELIVYDSIHHEYFLNCIYEISKQNPVIKTVHNHEFTSKCHIFSDSDL